VCWDHLSKISAKKAEAAASTIDFSLEKFVQFLGQRADEPMDEITRQDVAAVRDSLVGQVSAKTANHYVKALKMFFVPEERAPSLRILRVESQRFTVVSSNRPIAEARYQHGRPQHSNG
jgi:hypothetical protein